MKTAPILRKNRQVGIFTLKALPFSASKAAAGGQSAGLCKDSPAVQRRALRQVKPARFTAKSTDWHLYAGSIPVFREFFSPQTRRRRPVRRAS
jgi:hypothetical protein